ncbi:uncharacterized protein LOC110704694 [Chenopodium quinoa]|uniref:Uncharacterized protein n=1 Tax=Chenopodium quinoa TaxID=63459 RepID=A0A803MN10_CHEQI|nr:uncharacterized protein LOC110704694 [Chenopodium quinoa]
MDLTKMVISRISHKLSHRTYVIAPTRPLQKIFGIGKSEKEKEVDDACRKAKEATHAVKEGAQQIKETGEHVKSTAEKVSQTAGNIVNKMKEPIIGAVSNAWGNTTEKIEDKVAEKIRDRVMGKEDQEKSDDEKSK